VTSTPFTMRLLPEELAILDAAAARLNVSRAAVVRALILRHAAKLEAAESRLNDPTRQGRRKRAKAKGGA
jgi:hypothetical protein